ncbi:DMT family transporter, partial [Mycobacterium montefiorense]
AVALLPAAALALLTPFAVHDTTNAVIAVGGMVLLNATLAVSLYLRAISLHGAAAVAMLFAVIPAAAAVLAWLMLGQRPDVGVAIGLLLGGLACWLNSKGTSRHRAATPSAAPVTAPAAAPPAMVSCSTRSSDSGF